MTTPIEILKEARDLHVEKVDEIAQELKEWEEMLKKENNKVHEFDKAIELLSRPKEVREVKPVARPLAEKIEPEEPITQKHFKFIDLPGTPLAIKECTTALKTVRYGKRQAKHDIEFTIRAENTESVLKVSWEELISFYARLPERTPLKNITGINKSKVSILTEFYCAHPNFTCRIETLGKGNEGRTVLLIKDEVLVKEEVTVKTDTAPLERNVDVE